MHKLFVTTILDVVEIALLYKLDFKDLHYGVKTATLSSPGVSFLPFLLLMRTRGQ
jgi:hypothetical protein